MVKIIFYSSLIIFSTLFANAQEPHLEFRQVYFEKSIQLSSNGISWTHFTRGKESKNPTKSFSYCSIKSSSDNKGKKMIHEGLSTLNYSPLDDMFFIVDDQDNNFLIFCSNIVSMASNIQLIVEQIETHLPADVNVIGPRNKFENESLY